MESTYIILATITILMNAGVAIADFLRAPFVLANSVQVGVPPSWLPVLGGLKGAGAVGLACGLLYAPLALAAVLGLVLFYCGAIIAHIRAGVLHNLAFPATFLAFPAACLVMFFL